MQNIPGKSMLTIDQMLNEIRSIIARCKANEKDTYEALCSEADGWNMRLEELEKMNGD